LNAGKNIIGALDPHDKNLQAHRNRQLNLVAAKSVASSFQTESKFSQT